MTLKLQKQLVELLNQKDFNLNQLESEFSTLYQLFISNKMKWEADRNNEAIQLLEALCDLMIRYYEHDHVRGKLEELKKKKEEIASFRNPENDQASNNQLTGSFSELRTSLSSSAQWKDNLSFLNAYRIYWIFCHDLVNQSVNLLEASNFAAYLADWNTQLGLQYSTADFLKMLDKPQEVLRVLSVGIYALRLMINLVTMAKHIIKAKLDEDLASEQVLTHEIEKRIFTLVNDAVWSTINLVTNFSKQFNISDLAVNNITLASLAFDMALLTANWLFDAKQYTQRVAELEQQKVGLNPNSTELAVIQRQLHILNDNWEAQNAYYAINLAAASCLFVGFGVTLVIPAGLAITTLSMIGAALYATADEYKNYKQSAIAFKRELMNGAIENSTVHHDLMKQLRVESEEAYIKFWKSLTYNTAGPAFVLTAAAFSWPLALLIAATFMTYQATTKNVNEKKAADGVYRLLDKPIPEGTKPTGSYSFFESTAKAVKQYQPISTTGAIAHCYHWLTSFAAGDYVYENPNFKGSKDEGVVIYCTHGTADQSGSFGRVAERLIAAGLPDNVSSIRLVSFNSRYQGKSIDFFAKQLADKIEVNGDKHVILIGHSRGCLVNTQAAEEHLSPKGVKVERIINLCGPFGGSDLAMMPATLVSSSVDQMKVNSSFLQRLKTKIMNSSLVYNFVTATEDWIVRPDLAYTPEYVEQHPESLVELDRHGHLSILSSHRLVGLIRDYVIDSCRVAFDLTGHASTPKG